MYASQGDGRRIVHCRVGSLESEGWENLGPAGVHCRVGSLEKRVHNAFQECNVHCRVGSLEKCWPG